MEKKYFAICIETNEIVISNKSTAAEVKAELGEVAEQGKTYQMLSTIGKVMAVKTRQSTYLADVTPKVTVDAPEELEATEEGVEPAAEEVEG